MRFLLRSGVLAAVLTSLLSFTGCDDCNHLRILTRSLPDATWACTMTTGSRQTATWTPGTFPANRDAASGGRPQRRRLVERYANPGGRVQLRGRGGCG